MNELGLDNSYANSWFSKESNEAYVLIRISKDNAQKLVETLGEAVRRCYVTDDKLNTRAVGEITKTKIVSALLPDPGPVMSGDFGEILTFIYQAVSEHPSSIIGPKKWRLKESRNKAAPFSDIVQFHLPKWPSSSDKDVIFCSEVKAKSTKGNFEPIVSAIEGCKKDRTSRLASTLLWLHEKALLEDLGSLKLEHLDRFLKPDSHPPAEKQFRAVAVICSNLLGEELNQIPVEPLEGYEIVVISVPQLKEVYTAVFDAAKESVQDKSLSSATEASA